MLLPPQVTAAHSCCLCFRNELRICARVPRTPERADLHLSVASVGICVTVF